MDAKLESVSPLAAPVITAVTNSEGSLSNPATTSDPLLTLSGAASASEVVVILKNGKIIASASAPGGFWSISLIADSDPAENSFTARVGTELSRPWIITIEQVDELLIDSSLMILDGKLIHGWDLEPTTPPVHTSQERTAIGGVPPYTYGSSNATVAYVKPSTGLVFSVGNGSATITVTDQRGSLTSYPVTVSNVLQIFTTNLTALYQTCANQAASRGGHILTLQEWREFFYAYRPNHTGIPSEWCWTSTPSDLMPGTTWLFGPDNGQSLARPLDHLAPGFGLMGLLPVLPEPVITINNMYYSTPFEPALRSLSNGGQLPPPAGDLAGHQFQITINGVTTANAPFVYCISHTKPPAPTALWMTVMAPASGIVQNRYPGMFHPRQPATPLGRYHLYQRIAGQPVELPWSFIL